MATFNIEHYEYDICEDLFYVAQHASTKGLTGACIAVDFAALSAIIHYLNVPIVSSILAAACVTANSISTIHESCDVLAQKITGYNPELTEHCGVE